MTPPPHDVVTFDCYGTLIDWESGIREAFAAEARSSQACRCQEARFQRSESQGLISTPR